MNFEKSTCKLYTLTEDEEVGSQKAFYFTWSGSPHGDQQNHCLDLGTSITCLWKEFKKIIVVD